MTEAYHSQEILLHISTAVAIRDDQFIVLDTLIASTGTDDVASSYAATYPVALALIISLVKLIGEMIV